MSGKNRISLRHLQIDRSNAIIIAAIAVAAACLAFSLVATHALWGQATYNKRVIQAKEATVKQVQANIASLDSLKDSYQVFVSQPTNVIGGSATGSGDRDGDNAKITLDAMPSVYDFPGTISGLNKVLNGRSVTDVAISGIDEEASIASSKTEGVSPIPLSISAIGDIAGSQDFLRVLDLSIRPMNIKSISFTGESTGRLTTSVSLDTYYQPKKIFEVNTMVIK